MQISGTFLKSKVSRRIAVLLFIAAAIPAALMTLLSTQKVSELVTNYEHRSLVEKSRGYALSVFSNLVFARNALNNYLVTDSRTKKLENLSFDSASRQIKIFNSITEVLPNGTIADADADADADAAKSIPQSLLQNVHELKLGVPYLRLWSNQNAENTVNLVLRKNKNAGASLFIAEINPEYIWGDKLDYPSDLSVCAYQISNDTNKKLFCSSEYNSKTSTVKPSPLNSATWELFLAGELHGNPWLFKTNRLSPISSSHLKEFVGSKAYIGIAILSMLVIGLLSLIQIRKTMVPLEHLISGTQKIAEGDYSPVKVGGTSEFSELAGAFNNMSSHIKHQLETLESFSIIDKQIVSTVNVEKVIQLVIKRMQLLEPNTILLIACREEESANEVQCNCTVSGHDALTSIRLAIPTNEFAAIKEYNQGQIKQSSLTSELVHERLMAELGAGHLWVLPVFWQGEMCAFLSVGSKTKLEANQKSWVEFRELASRIGIVISAQEREEKLLLEAQYDSLTGLPNRILLQDRLNLAQKHSDHTGKPMWVVFIDVDRFKDVNDSMGHATGDSLLIELGQRLLTVTREEDTVARFGGDEFVIVLSGDAGESVLLSILNRIMDSVAEPIQINNHELVNTCSIGISTYPNDGRDAETLIKSADIAMYRAKELGRNNYQFFKQSLNDKAAERIQMVSLLRKAINKNEFELYYQPKVDLRTNKIVGLEALIRWSNTILGNVSPANFIPVAEEAGLITDIGEWVLRTACKQMAIWQKSGLGNLLMSVNLSARQLQKDNLVETIKTTLVETGLKAEHLELELTESILMDDTTKIVSSLHAIKSLGIQLSIDDFGTGYSNLSYLHTLPIDTLKIDKAFIDTVTISNEKAPIVATIISLAKNLDLKIVAEGVETLEQVYYLRAKDCDQMQGYYFSKALPASETRELLASGKKLDLPNLQLVKNTRS